MSYEKQYFSDGEIITASQLNHIENGIVAAGNVRNFLDNSNFLNPVNQRGSTSYTGNIYTIDRWALWNLDDTPTLTINAGSISMTQSLYQNILGADPDQTYTFAVMLESGVRVLSGVPALFADDGVLRLLVSVGGYVQVVIMGSHTLYWAALYEGEYTVDTLPVYQPKGYAAELAECQRYFFRFDARVNAAYIPCIAGTTQIAGFLFPTAMRIVPTMTIEELTMWTAAGATDVSGVISSKRCTTGGLQYIELTTAPANSGLVVLGADFSADL